MSLHITAKKEEVADRILLPGDPLRAKFIAEKYLEDAKCVNELRGALLYTGTYKGVKVSVMGSGMGNASIMIYATELCRDYDVQKLIRVGTGASFCKDLKIRDIALSQACSSITGINDYIFKGKYAPTADFDLLDKAYHLSKELNINAKAGNTLCYDLLYRDDKFFDLDTWKEYGVIAGEMETAGLYTVASHFGKQALSMWTIVVNLSESTDVQGLNGNRVSPEEREKALDDMAVLALETIIKE